MFKASATITQQILGNLTARAMPASRRTDQALLMDQSEREAFLQLALG